MISLLGQVLQGVGKRIEVVLPWSTQQRQGRCYRHCLQPPCSEGGEYILCFSLFSGIFGEPSARHKLKSHFRRRMINEQHLNVT